MCLLSLFSRRFLFPGISIANPLAQGFFLFKLFELFVHQNTLLLILSTFIVMPPAKKEKLIVNSTLLGKKWQVSQVLLTHFLN